MDTWQHLSTAYFRLRGICSKKRAMQSTADEQQRLHPQED